MQLYLWPMSRCYCRNNYNLIEILEQILNFFRTGDYYENACIICYRVLLTSNITNKAVASELCENLKELIIRTTCIVMYISDSNYKTYTIVLSVSNLLNTCISIQ